MNAVEKLLSEVRSQGPERFLEALGLNYTRKNSQLAIVCPFHPDRNPSLFVDNDGKWKCFGCDSGGGVIDFVEKYLGCSRSEAIKWLGEVYGVEVSHERINPRISAMRKLQKYFEESLIKSKEAKAYLKERVRELSVLEKYGVGYSDGSLPSDLTEEEMKALEKAGVVRNGECVFEGRITFPIKSLKNGGLIGWTARAIDSNVEPKYLLSRGIKKKEAIFGFPRNSKEVIVTEGTFDAIVTGGIAFLGVSLSEAQIEYLVKQAEEGKDIVLAFDVDAPGMQARLNATKQLVRHNIVPYTVIWDSKLGKDLADIYKKNPALLKRIMKKRMTFVDYLVKLYLHEKKDPARKQRYISYIIEILAEASAIAKDILIDSLSLLPKDVQEEILLVVEKKKASNSQKREKTKVRGARMGNQNKNEKASRITPEKVAMEVTDNPNLRLIVQAVLQKFNEVFEKSEGEIDISEALTKIALPFQLASLNFRDSLSRIRPEIGGPLYGRIWAEFIATHSLEITSDEAVLDKLREANKKWLEIRKAYGDTEEEALLSVISAYDIFFSSIATEYLEDPLGWKIDEKKLTLAKNEFGLDEKKIVIALSRFIASLALVCYAAKEKMENVIKIAQLATQQETTI